MFFFIIKKYQNIIKKNKYQNNTTANKNPRILNKSQNKSKHQSKFPNNASKV
jgi:hypothetical protein